MTREEKIQAITDYFAWAEQRAAIVSKEASLAAYDEYLELEELRELRERYELVTEGLH